MSHLIHPFRPAPMPWHRRQSMTCVSDAQESAAQSAQLAPGRFTSRFLPILMCRAPSLSAILHKPTPHKTGLRSLSHEPNAASNHQFTIELQVHIWQNEVRMQVGRDLAPNVRAVTNGHVDGAHYLLGLEDV